jgi:hypothetical protein
MHQNSMIKCTQKIKIKVLVKKLVSLKITIKNNLLRSSFSNCKLGVVIGSVSSAELRETSSCISETKQKRRFISAICAATQNFWTKQEDGGESRTHTHLYANALSLRFIALAWALSWKYRALLLFRCIKSANTPDK